MVGVNAINGEVVGGCVVGGVPQQVACFDGFTICGEEIVTFVDVLGLLPLLVGNVPELVVRSVSYGSHSDCPWLNFLVSRRASWSAARVVSGSR